VIGISTILCNGKLS